LEAIVSQKEQLEKVKIDRDESELKSRRDFLVGLGKWSKVIIGGAVFGRLLTLDKQAQAAWVNRRGGWVNGRGSGGGGWANARGGGGWANRRGGGGWVNRR
jgi:hypothetical protein